MLSTFAEFERDIIRERVKAGIASAREKGNRHGRPQTAAKKKDEVKKLYKNGTGLNKSQIARRLKISRASVINLLKQDYSLFICFVDIIFSCPDTITIK